jgi:hypothetical protein
MEDLLEKARRQAEKADTSIRAAALLRIARAESTGDVSRGRRTLIEGLDAVQTLPTPVREDLLEEARLVAAAISPELLAEIPETHRARHERFASGHIVQTMVAHGHVDAAFNYLIEYDAASFPFLSVGIVLHRLDRQSSESADRRLILLRRALEVWRQSPSGRHSHQRDQFVRLFGHHWQEFPDEEASAVALMIVDRVVTEPDTETSSGYNEINFSSRRQDILFQILHVLRHLDPALAQSLVDSHDQLAVGARRYPNGLETMNEEVEAEAKRRKADGATCGGYVLAGDPCDFDRQRRLIDASRSGDFAQSIEDALGKYREDTSPATPNYAPKEYWPSTGAVRRVFYQAGKRLGSDAVVLLGQIPDDDLRLFASIELAAALAYVPGPAITQMKQPNPAHSRSFGSGQREGPDGPRMRSPGGQLIRCPKCLFQPAMGLRWTCDCGHSWNTFSTSGRCPSCDFQWEVTQCPGCGEISEHRAWYVSEP